MPTSHSESPRLGSFPTAMNPQWPLMLMSSTLASESSSVLRSRPIGLPRYQEKEKCGPRIPPPASHWHPTEFRAVLSSPLTLVSSATVWSLMPPHCGNIGPWLPCPFCGVDDAVAPGLLPPESEQAATAGIRIVNADATRASALALRRTATLLPFRPLLVHTMHCSGSPSGQPPTRLSRDFHAANPGGAGVERAAVGGDARADGVRQLPNAPGTAAPVHPAVPPAGRGADGAAADQQPRVAVPADRQCRHHRRGRRQGRHHHDRQAR